MKYLNFNTTTGTMRGVFTLDTSIDAETVVYLNTEYWYPNGFNVFFQDGYAHLEQDYKFDGERITFKITDKSLNGHMISVLITQKDN